MSNILNKVIAECSEQADVSFDNDYSGHAMYGRRCIGLSSDLRTIQMVIASVIVELRNQIVEDPTEDEDYTEQDFEQDVEKLMDWRIESMGRHQILYWPEIEPIENYDEGD